jgi:hypothetical protein
MATSQWHKFYSSLVAAPPAILFGLLSDMPNYGRWLPGSAQFAETTDVEPYPVRLGSRYHDGKPGEPGKGWWGTVTGFQPPGSLDFHHTIEVSQLKATVDVHIHYSFERGGRRHAGHPVARPRRDHADPLPSPTTTDHQKLRRRERADHGGGQEVREAHPDGIPGMQSAT